MLQIYTSGYDIGGNIDVGNISDKQKRLWRIMSGTESINVSEHSSTVIATTLYQQNADYSFFKLFDKFSTKSTFPFFFALLRKFSSFLYP